jgi:hypothetical protein
MEVSMKKSTIILLITILIILLLTICFFIIRRLVDSPSLFTMRWQTVYVNEIGSFRIPQEWSIEYHNEVIFITDKPRRYMDYTLILIGVTQVYGAASNYTQPHELLDGVYQDKLIRSAIFSNSSSLQLHNYIINENEKERFVINMPRISNGFNALNLLVWNKEIVNEQLASEIARTFSMRIR